MKRVERYARPAELSAALALASADRDARWLAGGTSLLAGDYADKPSSVIDISAVVPGGIGPRAGSGDGGSVVIGAGCTLQELADAPEIPEALREAALGMGSRNVRNRATVGGNIAADRPCSCLIPSLLVLDATLQVAGMDGGGAGLTRQIGLAEWLQAPSGLILEVKLPTADALAAGSRRAAYARWARTATDAAVLGVAVSFRLQETSIRDLRVAIGGVASKSRRDHKLEKRFESWPVQASVDDRPAIEAAALPFLLPDEFGTVGADFRRVRGAALFADVLTAAMDRGGAR